MSGRNHGRPHPFEPVEFPPIHDSPFNRDSRLLPPPRHHALIEERLELQHQDIQTLLLNNQRLAATHVALKQDLEVAQYELKRMVQIAGSLQADKDVEFRQVFEKSVKLEADLRVVDGMRADCLKVRDDIRKMNASRLELAGQVEGLTRDLVRANADLQQVPALKADIETMKQELQRARAAIDYEKKGHVENLVQGEAMDKNLTAMAREVEMLRAEIANAEKRARAAAAISSTGPGYGGNYSYANSGYGGGSYPVGYGMNPVQGGAENAAQYGPGRAAWGAYDMQHGRR